MIKRALFGALLIFYGQKKGIISCNTLLSEERRKKELKKVGKTLSITLLDEKEE